MASAGYSLPYTAAMLAHVVHLSTLGDTAVAAYAATIKGGMSVRLPCGARDSNQDQAQVWGDDGLHLLLQEPAIIQALLGGQPPKCVSLLWFQRNPLPTDWVAQREVVTGSDA